MILDRLTLHNFGIYRGRHSFELTPLPGKPVILFVGLNGAGKTTILTALQLAFYGAQAPSVRHAADIGGYTFEDYLLDCINYEDPPADSASIEVEFHATREGEEQHFLVRRSWRRVEDTADLREGMAAHRVEVFVNDRPDAALSAAWAEAVEEFLPLRLSTLFFFDGEKIEQWSNWRAAEQLISDAVQSLLGLDVIDRAVADLDVIQRKAAVDSAPDDNDRALAALHEQVGERQKARAGAEQQRAGAADAVKRAEGKIKELEPKLAARGIPLLDRKAELTALRDAASERLERTRSEERQRRTEADRSRRDRERFGELLRQRDTAMLAAAPAKIRGWLEDWLRTQVTADFREKEAVLPESGASESTDSGASFAQREKKLKAEVERLDGLLTRIPEENEAADLLKERAIALRELERAQFRADEFSAALAQHDSALAPLLAEVQRRAAAAHARERAHEAGARYATTAAASVTALGAFRSRLIREHCSTLSQRLAANFARLLHKTELFDATRIVPSTESGTLRFRLVVERRSRELDPDRFSAGERQMLALALLCALAQTSGRRAPVVIDTPLARLDSAHRTNVATEYIPNAAEQVIMLATDEEREAFRGSRHVAGTIGLRDHVRMAA
jgi:DNA sulfur modification protein DndD